MNMGHSITQLTNVYLYNYNKIINDDLELVRHSFEDIFRRAIEDFC